MPWRDGCISVTGLYVVARTSGESIIGAGVAANFELMKSQ